MGTIVNVLAVIVGSGIGLGLRNGLPERLRTILTQACGLSVVFIGIAGAMAGMLSVADGALGTEGSILLVLSLVLGGLTNEERKAAEKLIGKLAENAGRLIEKEYKKEAETK